jgi:hypothetical protein
VLPFGQVLKLGNYSVQARLPAPPAAQQDPWSVFDQDPGSSDATLPRAAMMTAPPAAQSVADGILPEEDPFGDWGFQSTFGPDSGSEPPPQGPPTTSHRSAEPRARGTWQPSSRASGSIAPTPAR